MKIFEKRFIKVRQIVFVSGIAYMSPLLDMAVTTTNTTERRIAEAQTTERMFTVICNPQTSTLDKGAKIRIEDGGAWFITTTSGADTPTSKVNSNLDYVQAQAKSYVPLDEEKDLPVLPDPSEPPPEPEPEPRPDPQDVRLLYVTMVSSPLGGYYPKYWLSHKFSAWVYDDKIITELLSTRPNDNLISLGSRLRLEDSKAWRTVTSEPLAVDNEFTFNTEAYTPTADELGATVQNP